MVERFFGSSSKIRIGHATRPGCVADSDIARSPKTNRTVPPLILGVKPLVLSEGLA